MFICAAGDIHGALDQLYSDVLAFEASLGVRFDHVLHVGDFGIWPDPQRIDKATRKHDGAGDFLAWLAEGRAAPRPTVFIKGNHEDFVWLEEQRVAGKREVIPGLTYLHSGETIDLDSDDGKIRVGGIGGCYGPLPRASCQQIVFRISNVPVRWITRSILSIKIKFSTQ